MNDFQSKWRSRSSVSIIPHEEKGPFPIRMEQLVSRHVSSEAKQRRTTRWFVGLWLLFAVGLAAAIAYYYNGEQQTQAEHAERELLAVAVSKAEQLTSWQRERLTDSRILQASAVRMQAVDRMLTGRASAADSRSVSEWLDVFRQQAGYTNGLLVDRSGTLLVSSGTVLGDARHLKELASRLGRNGVPELHDLHQETPGLPHMGLNVPLLSADGARLRGAVLLGIDPRAALFPILQPWAGAGETAEVLLVRREGDSVLHLSGLRFRGDSAMRLKSPLTETRNPAVQAALGQEGPFRGVNYNGVEVFSAIRRVEGTSWIVIAETDAAEVYSALRVRLGLLVLTAAALLFGAAALGFMFWRSISERLRQEEEKSRRDREALVEHFESVGRYANDIILLLEDDGTVLEANDRAAEAYGIPRAQLLGSNVARLLSDPQLADPGEGVFESFHRRADGSLFPVEASVRVVDSGGERYRQMIIRDISERKQAEERLRVAHDTLQAVILASPVAIAALTPEGIVTSWNQAAERIFGWTAAEAIGRSLPVVPPAKQEEFRGLRERIASGESFAGLELDRQRKDGSAVRVSLYTAPLRTFDGRITGILSMMLDVTDSWRAKRGLEDSERRFRQVVEGAPEGIFISTGGCFRYLNEVAVKAFGAGSESELLHRPVINQIHPSDRQAISEHIQSLRSGQPVALHELQYIRLDGVVVSVEASAVPTSYLGETGAIVFFRDITERKKAAQEQARLKEQILQAQKMESIGRLAGGVAHDFNNILMVINGYSDLLLARTPTSDPSHKALSEIRQAGENAAGLTRQLLAFGRRQPALLQPIDLNRTLAGLQDLLARLLGERIRLQFDLASRLPAVEADPSQIQQVILNLVLNARDAMPDGGSVWISTALSENTAESGALLSIRDSGHGMDEATRASIFEPFFTTKKPGAGTGLGLAAVYGIVTQMGGRIDVESKLNEGTRFGLFFPASATMAQEEDRPRPEPSRGGQETILLVEDQPEVRQLTAHILRSRGYLVLESEHGDDALRISAAHKGTIDLLVSDVVMPGMTVAELTRELRRERAGLRVICVSGYPADTLTGQGLLPPGADYLPKPYSPDTLASRVRHSLDQR